MLIAFLALAVIPIMYWPEIKKRLTRRQEEKASIILDDEEAVRRNPGNGEVAARLIARAEPFDKAVSIFNDFKLAPRRIAEVRPYAAMVIRLRLEGMTAATVKYLQCENNEENFEWDLDEFVDKAVEQHDDFPIVLRRMQEEL